MKSLKMKSLKSSLLMIIVMFVIGIALLTQVAQPILKIIKGPVPMEEVDFTGDVDGLYVKVTLSGIYDWYCEETEGSTKLVSREYIIDADDYYYMGMRVMKKDMDPAENLLDASMEYLYGDDTEGTGLEAAQYEVKGTIERMPSDSLKLYHEYLEWDTMDAESQELFLPYYLQVNKAGDTDLGGVAVFGILVVFFLGLGIFFLIRVLCGSGQKRIREYIAKSSNPDAAREKVEYFLNNTPEVNGLRYNHDFICGQDSATTSFGETSKLVWAYQLTTTHKRGLITVGKSYSLMLAFADGSRQSVTMANEECLQKNLQALSELCPQAIFGYSDELDKMFRKEFSKFLSMKYNTVNNDTNSTFDTVQ